MSRVREYYEANTGAFLRFGSEGAIHRELWAAGVTSRAQAVHYVHTLILEQVHALCPGGSARLLDLGCGVGAAARFLAARAPARIYGVSLSPRQVALANGWSVPGPVLGTSSFYEADFCALPSALVHEMEPIDLAFAIEAFVHAGSSAAFFREVARVLRPGGHLIIIDDVLAENAPDIPLLDDVRTGWHMDSLLPVTEIAREAASQGLCFAGSDDLSAIQRLGRPRDRLVHALQPVLRRARRFSLWADSLVGGDALQTCHRQGLLKYELLRFDKPASAST